MGNNCNLCGKKLGIFDKRTESFYEQEYHLCEECGWAIDHYKRALKDKKKNELTQVKTELLSLVSSCPNAELKTALLDWVNSSEDLTNLKVQDSSTSHTCPICGGKIGANDTICNICGYEFRGVFLSKEEKLKTVKNKLTQLSINPVYEYAVEVLKDSDVLGILSKESLEDTIMQYALSGWRLHTAFTKEIGKNAVLGINATINETYLIFERCIKAEGSRKEE